MIKNELNINEKNVIFKHSVLPGITGLSQIHSKGSKRTLNEKLDYDMTYVEKKVFICIYLYYSKLYMSFSKGIRTINLVIRYEKEKYFNYSTTCR